MESRACTQALRLLDPTKAVVGLDGEEAHFGKAYVDRSGSRQIWCVPAFFLTLDTRMNG